MSVKLNLKDVEGGYMINIAEGELPNGKYENFLQHTYKYKHVAVDRIKKIEKEINLIAE